MPTQGTVSLSVLVKKRFKMSMEDFAAHCDRQIQNASVTHRVSISQSLACLRVAVKLRSLVTFSGRSLPNLASSLSISESLLKDIDTRSVLVSIAKLDRVEQVIDRQLAHHALSWREAMEEDYRGYGDDSFGNDMVPVKD